MAAITRLGAHGGPRSLYGSFAGKVAAPAGDRLTPGYYETNVRLVPTHYEVAGLDISPTGIISLEAFGSAVVTTGVLDLSPTSITSTEAFGTTIVTPVNRFRIVPRRLETSTQLVPFHYETSGLIGLNISPTGIASTEAFGSAGVVGGALFITPTGIASTEAFGTTVVATSLQDIAPTGIASTEAFGTTIVAATATTVDLAMGVPQPSIFWGGNDPLLTATPADPASWPSAETAGFYYIDPDHVNATDTGNTFGYPNKPRVTISLGTSTSPHPPGTLIRLRGNFPSGGDGTYTFYGAGSQTNHVFFSGIEGDEFQLNRDFLVRGSYITIEHMNVGLQSKPRVRISSTSGAGNSHHHILFRHCIGTGDGVNRGFSSTYGVDGAGTGAVIPGGDGVSHDIVFYDVLTELWGEYQASVENDFHGWKVGERAFRVWFIDCEAHKLGGDGVQIGDDNTPRIDWVEQVFVSNCDFSNNGENGFDTKACKDILCSGSILGGFDDINNRPPGGGFGVTIQSGGENIIILDCDIGDGFAAVGITGSGLAPNEDSEDIYIVGNTIYGTRKKASDGSSETDPYGGGIAVYIRNSDRVNLLNNTFHDNVIHVSLQTGADHRLHNNIFHQRTSNTSLDIVTDLTSTATSSLVDNCLFFSTHADVMRVDYAGTIRTSLSGWSEATDCLIADPKVITAPGPTFLTTTPDGAGIDQGQDSHFTAFQALVTSLFGTNTVTEDGFDNPRFTSTIDIGVYEYPGAISPTGIGSLEAFGSATIAGGVVDIAPTGISSAEIFGVSVVTAAPIQDIDPTGIASVEIFGTAVLTVASNITPTGLASTEAFGSAALTIDIVPTGIASTEAFGAASLGLDIPATGIASAETFGATIIVVLGASLDPPGIVSTEAFGSAVITTGAVDISPTGLASTETFGSSLVFQGLGIDPPGITSTEVFGSAVITIGATNISPTGITSVETFGGHFVSSGLPQILELTGIPSAEAFGKHRVLNKFAKEFYGGIARKDTGKKKPKSDAILKAQIQQDDEEILTIIINIIGKYLS